MGIDPGSHIMGWGLIEKKSNSMIVPLKYGCITSRPHVSSSDLLLNISNALSKIIEENHPDCLAIEQLFFFKNQKTVIGVAEARGVAILVCAQKGVPVFEYTPLQIKQALTGYGRADKKQIQEMVRLSCNLATCPKPDDAADALAAAICHAQTNYDLIKGKG